MWTVVCFTAENSIDIVPDFWFCNGSCAWPKKIVNCKKFIDKRIQPNEIDFDYYDARVLSTNIESISEARLKVIKAQETSELSSNDDDKHTRKIRRKMCFSPSSNNSSPKQSKLSSPPLFDEFDELLETMNNEETFNHTQMSSDTELGRKMDDDDDDDNNELDFDNFSDLTSIKTDFIPQTSNMSQEIRQDHVFASPKVQTKRAKLPIPSRTATVTSQTSKISQELMQQKYYEKPSSENANNYENEAQEEEVKLSNPSRIAVTSQKSKIYQESLQQGLYKSPENNTRKTENQKQVKKIKVSPLKALRVSNEPKQSHAFSTLANSINSIANEIKGFKQISTRNQVTMKYEIKSLQERTDIIMKMQEKILDKLNNQSYETLDDTLTTASVSLMESDEDLENMESKLLKDKAFRKSVIIELSRLMGQNLSETVRRIMQKLFSDHLLAEFSFIGFKGKKHFSTLQIMAVITESIRRMKKFNEITDVEIEKPLKNWLAQAPARIKKTEKKISNQNNSA